MNEAGEAGRRGFDSGSGINGAEKKGLPTSLDRSFHRQKNRVALRLRAPRDRGDAQTSRNATYQDLIDVHQMMGRGYDTVGCSRHSGVNSHQQSKLPKGVLIYYQRFVPVERIAFWHQNCVNSFPRP